MSFGRTFQLIVRRGVPIATIGACVVIGCSQDVRVPTSSARLTPTAPLPIPPVGGPAMPSGPEVNRIAISPPPRSEMVVHDTLVLNAIAMDSAGRPIAAAPVMWSVVPSTAEHQPGEATVDSSGRLIAVKSGYVWARATSGSRADSVRLHIHNHVVLTLSLASTAVAVGARTTVRVGARDSSGAVFYSISLPFSVTSSDSSVVSVENPQGIPSAYFAGISFALRGKRTGVATIAINVDGESKSLAVQVFTVSFATVVTANGFVSNGFACGITLSAAAYCWGDNQWGQLGSPTQAGCSGSGGQYCATYVESATPLLVSGNLRFRALALGGANACGITTGDDVYCWGAGATLGTNAAVGICSDGGYYNDAYGACSATPVPIAGQTKFRSIAVSGSQTCGVARTGESYCWGVDLNQLPTPVAPGFAFDTIVPGGNGPGAAPTCGLMPTGEAYCWGNKAFGESPQRVSGAPELLSIGSTLSNQCGLSRAGQVYCWGNDLQAKPVLNAPTFRVLSAGYTSLCGLNDTGLAYCWGNVSVPTPSPLADAASGPLHFTSISTGYYAKLCGIAQDGIAYCSQGNFTPDRVPGQP